MELDKIIPHPVYAWMGWIIEIIDDKHFVEYAKNNYPTYFTITSKEKLKEYKNVMILKRIECYGNNYNSNCR